MAYQPKLGFWLTDASIPAAEIAAALGFRFVVLDAEHGMFDLRTLDYVIPALKGLGLDVWVKVLGPSQEAIQQALDFGASGVIVPHIGALDHATRVCGYSKFPPNGERSLSGGRPFGWKGCTTEQLHRMNAETACFPLVEHPAAVRDIESIMGLSTVDGIQMGPGDLSVTSGRGAYAQSPADFADFERCIAACRSAGKPWLFPAWTEREQRWALDQEAPLIMISMQYYVLRAGLTQAKEAFDVLAAAERLRR